MKLGLGLYRHTLTRENFQFARQAGATHIVAHLVDYFKDGAKNPRDNQPTGTERGWGRAGDPDKLWTADELIALRKSIEAEGLKLEAIENFDPAHWHDVLLDGPKKKQQLENVKTIIRNLGRAGIPIMGYNFSIAGVCGRTHRPYARGGAMSVGMEGPLETPMPNGMAWNMVVDENAPEGNVPAATPEQLWGRLAEFLHEVIPVAEESGVKLALHPDDPPLPTMRGQPRLVYQPQLYQRVIDLQPSRANTLEFCLGSLTEMTDGDIYETVERYSRQQKLGYVHFRNVTGKVPFYRETFVDDGDIDMPRVLRILKKNSFDGVLIPDHTPQMSCAAPWHAGMAFAMGYMKAALQIIEKKMKPLVVGTVPRRQCGRFDLKLPLLGMGAWAYGGGDYWGPQSQQDVDAVVRSALDYGCNFFDTAEAYNQGGSESSLGLALRGLARDKVLIATKIAPSNVEPATLSEHLEASLRRLQTDYVDIYMVHWPITAHSIRHFTAENVPVPSVPDAFDALMRLQRAGKIRHIGVSNFGVAKLTEALATGAEIVINELPYSLMTRAIELEILPFCREKGIGVLGYISLFQGILGDAYPTLTDIPEWRQRTRHFDCHRTPRTRHGLPGTEAEMSAALASIRAIARQNGMTTTELALKWAFAGNGITSSLCGSRNLKQLQMNLKAATEPLDEALVAELNRATDPLLQALGPSFDYYEHPSNDRTK